MGLSAIPFSWTNTVSILGGSGHLSVTLSAAGNLQATYSASGSQNTFDDSFAINLFTGAGNASINDSSLDGTGAVAITMWVVVLGKQPLLMLRTLIQSV
jgi:hypothetical protein